MNVEKLIKDNVSNLKVDTFCRIYISPDIPDKKMNNAISTYAKEVEPEYVLVVIDTSMFGSAKDGLLFTGNKIFCSNVGNKKSFELSKITEIMTEEYEEKTKDGGTEKKYKYYLMYDGKKERRYYRFFRLCTSRRIC